MGRPAQLSFCLLSALLLSGAGLEAQTAAPRRAERLRQLRLGKLETLRPPRPNPLEKALLMLEQSGPQWNYKGLYPEFFTKLGTGSGFAPRARYWKPRWRGSLFDLQAAFQVSVLNYHQHELQFGRIQTRGRRLFMPQKTYERIELDGAGPADEGRLFLYANLRYRYFPQEDYFGPGSESLPEDRTTYVFEEAAYDGVVGYQNRWLSAGARLGVLSIDVSGGTDVRFPRTPEVFDDTTVPGLAAQPGFFRLESTVQLDFRDIPGNPHRGALLDLAFLRFDDRGGSRYAFNRYAGDARAYLPLGSPQRVLAIRLYASHDDPAPGSEVPFYLQDYLGGSHSLRGFRRNRFVDRNLLALSAEYRWEALPFVELAWFYDSGKAFAHRSEFNFSGLRRSYGIGARFKSYRAVGFRVDVAWGDEGTRLYLKFSPVF
jgi:hypothetical protein